MWDKAIIDTRRFGDASALMDGFVHFIPVTTPHKHWVSIECWCEPRLTWPKDGVTVFVSHRHLRVPKDLHVG